MVVILLLKEEGNRRSDGDHLGISATESRVILSFQILNSVSKTTLPISLADTSSHSDISRSLQVGLPEKLLPALFPSSFLLLKKQIRWLELQKPSQTMSDLEYGSLVLKKVGHAGRENLRNVMINVPAHQS